MAVDLRSTAKELEEGTCGSLEGLQGQLQSVCRLAINAYMEQQGDEGNLMHPSIHGLICVTSSPDIL